MGMSAAGLVRQYQHPPEARSVSALSRVAWLYGVKSSPTTVPPEFIVGTPLVKSSLISESPKSCAIRVGWHSIKRAVSRCRKHPSVRMIYGIDRPPPPVLRPTTRFPRRCRLEKHTTPRSAASSPHCRQISSRARDHCRFVMQRTCKQSHSAAAGRVCSRCHLGSNASMPPELPVPVPGTEADKTVGPPNFSAPVVISSA